MILPDVNLLIYAVDETSAFHGAGRRWWDETLSSPLPVGLCYPSVLGFVRITTSRQILESPLDVGTAVALVESWLAQPQTTLLAPTSRHWRIVSELLRVTGVGGNLTTDADIRELPPTRSNTAARCIRTTAISTASRGCAGRIHSRRAERRPDIAAPDQFPRPMSNEIRKMVGLTLVP